MPRPIDVRLVPMQSHRLVPAGRFDKRIAIYERVETLVKDEPQVTWRLRRNVWAMWDSEHGWETLKHLPIRSEPPATRVEAAAFGRFTMRYSASSADHPRVTDRVKYPLSPAYLVRDWDIRWVEERRDEGLVLLHVAYFDTSTID